MKENEGVISVRKKVFDIYVSAFQVDQYSGEQKRNNLEGFPGIIRNWCNSELKISPMNKIKKDCISYLGIAVDEPRRFHNLTDTKRSPLVEAGWTEQKCRIWCEENGLLSPIYISNERVGCWFCHYQGVQQLRLLRKNYPEYWALMLKWDTDSTRLFHSDGHTVHDFDKRFHMEYLGIVPSDKRFRWNTLNQTNVFDSMDKISDKFRG